MTDSFQRTRSLLGQSGMDRLAAARVAVFGIGGVGGHAVEALARSGVGALDLFDGDTVCASNLNRQIIATVDTLGQSKAEAARTRVLSINPSCRVAARCLFYGPETAHEVDFSVYDYVVDAVDTVSAKLDIITRCKALGVPVITAMGAGNKLDPTRLQTADISRTRVCPLARVMRRELRRRGIDHVKCVFSDEEPVLPKTENLPDHPGRRSVPGSTAFVPACMGLILAGEVVKDIAGIAR